MKAFILDKNEYQRLLAIGKRHEKLFSLLMQNSKTSENSVEIIGNDVFFDEFDDLLIYALNEEIKNTVDDVEVTEDGYFLESIFDNMALDDNWIFDYQE